MRNILRTVLLLMSLMFSGALASQNGTPVETVSTKTVAFIIKKQKEQNPLTSQLALDIDKHLTSKKGIISSRTSIPQRTVTVKMNSDLPEEEIRKILTRVFVLEVESYSIVNTTK